MESITWQSETVALLSLTLTQTMTMASTIKSKFCRLKESFTTLTDLSYNFLQMDGSASPLWRFIYEIGDYTATQLRLSKTCIAYLYYWKIDCPASQVWNRVPLKDGFTATQLKEPLWLVPHESLLDCWQSRWRFPQLQQYHEFLSHEQLPSLRVRSYRNGSQTGHRCWPKNHYQRMVWLYGQLAGASLTHSWWSKFTWSWRPILFTYLPCQVLLDKSWYAGLEIPDQIPYECSTTLSFSFCPQHKKRVWVPC